MNSNVVTFKAIVNFVCGAEDKYYRMGRRNPDLTVYARHLETVTFLHDRVMDMHIQAFRSFCFANRDLIASRTLPSTLMRLIQFSETLQFDVVKLLEDLDNDFVYQHLTLIASLV